MWIDWLLSLNGSPNEFQMRPLRQRLRHERAARRPRCCQARSQVRDLRPLVLQLGGAEVAPEDSQDARLGVRTLREEVPKQDAFGDSPGTESIAACLLSFSAPLEIFAVRPILHFSLTLTDRIDPILKFPRTISTTYFCKGIEPIRR